MKDPLRALAPFCPVRTQPGARKQALTRHKSAGTLILSFWLPILGKINICCLSNWQVYDIFITVAQTDEDSLFEHCNDRKSDVTCIILTVC